MAKIPYPLIEDTPQKIQTFFNKIKANSPRILNVNLMMAHSPGSVRELIRLGNRLLFRAELNPRFRELAIIRVSRLCGSPYEMAQHIPIALESGISREQIENIEMWQDSGIFSEEEKVVLAFREKLCRSLQIFGHYQPGGIDVINRLLVPDSKVSEDVSGRY
jgi:alkylhydroperoxidase family enzyme